MAMALPPLRRVVAAADASGKSTIVEDGPPPAVRPSVRPGFQSRNIWATFGSPAPLGDGREPGGSDGQEDRDHDERSARRAARRSPARRPGGC